MEIVGGEGVCALFNKMVRTQWSILVHNSPEWTKKGEKGFLCTKTANMVYGRPPIDTIVAINLMCYLPFNLCSANLKRHATIQNGNQYLFS